MKHWIIALRFLALLSCLLLAMTFSLSTARASVISIGPGAFPGGSALLTFTALAYATEVNGLSVGGAVFSYSLGNGQVLIGGGPGVTNNIDTPNIVSTQTNSGTLTVTLPSLATMFGYGYAIWAPFAIGEIPNPTTITLFNGVTNVGSLPYTGVPDPNYLGGFAGIQSTLAFDRVELLFDSVQAKAFAIDNVRFDSEIPEPATLALIGLGLTGLALLRRNSTKS